MLWTPNPPTTPHTQSPFASRNACPTKPQTSRPHDPSSASPPTPNPSPKTSSHTQNPKRTVPPITAPGNRSVCRRFFHFLRDGERALNGLMAHTPPFGLAYRRYVGMVHRIGPTKFEPDMYVGSNNLCLSTQQKCRSRCLRASHEPYNIAHKVFLHFCLCREAHFDTADCRSS